MVLAYSMKKDDKTVSDGLVCEQLLLPKSSQTDEKHGEHFHLLCGTR